MSFTPHTSVQKGKRVQIELKDGKQYIGKFVEKKGNFVVLEAVKIWAGKIKSFKIVKGKS